MAQAFVQPGAHPIAGNYGPNLEPVAEGTISAEPTYTAGREVNLVNHTASTSDVVAKQNIPLTTGGHARATAPDQSKTGKHLAKW